MPLHFAYGSNMDAAVMARRCPRSRLVGRARLARWRFVVMPSGFASVVPDPRSFQTLINGYERRIDDLTKEVTALRLKVRELRQALKPPG